MAFATLLIAMRFLASDPDVTTDRPKCCGSDNRVIVVSANEQMAVALGRSLALEDGSIRFWTYTVYRYGTADTAWTTPAYVEGAFDVRCNTGGVRLLFTRLYRGNADPLFVQYADNEGPFIHASDPSLKKQVEVACGTDPRFVYEQHYLFMEAYGLNDGREARVPPGPMVP